jgi:glutathione S-transferase
MLTLYYFPQTRATRPRWLLEELGVPYELKRVNLAAGEHKKPEYLKINPNGAVPALVDDGLALFESAAICQYLADKFPEKKMAPPVGTPARGLYYQWMHYAMAGLEPPALAIFLHTRMRPEADRIPRVVEEAKPQMTAAISVVERALGSRPFLLGDDFTAADVMVGSVLGWAAALRLVGDEFPTTKAYVNRLRERPAFKRAAAD